MHPARLRSVHRLACCHGLVLILRLGGALRDRPQSDDERESLLVEESHGGAELDRSVCNECVDCRRCFLLALTVGWLQVDGACDAERLTPAEGASMLHSHAVMRSSRSPQRRCCSSQWSGAAVADGPRTQRRSIKQQRATGESTPRTPTSGGGQRGSHGRAALAVHVQRVDCSFSSSRHPHHSVRSETLELRMHARCNCADWCV